MLDSLSTHTAQLALLILRASLSSPHSAPSGYILLPETTVLTEAQAIAGLAALNKPVICRAGWVGSNLQIDCESYPGSRHSLAEHSVTAMANGLRYVASERTADPLLLFRSDSAELLVPLSTFGSYQEQYVVVGASYSLHPVDAAARSKGAAGLVPVVSNSGATLEVRIEH